MTKLVDLNSRFVSSFEGRTGMGVRFDCPCGCKEVVCLWFSNPIDKGKPVLGLTWQRSGETLENLTLKPSIRRLGACGWHGYLTEGVFKKC